MIGTVKKPFGQKSWVHAKRLIPTHGVDRSYAVGQAARVQKHRLPFTF